MSRLALASLTLLIAAFCWPASAEDSTYFTGEDYMKSSPAERTAYVVGAHDMQARLLRELDNAEATAFIERVLRCTKDLTSTQLRDLIDDYMAKDAVYRTYTMASNIRAALNEKCKE